MAEGSLPTNASAPSGGDPGPRRPMARRTEPTHPCGSAQNRRNSTQDFGLTATAQPISTVPAQSGVGAPGAPLSSEELG
jgi:hypothetical protein